MAVLSDVTVRKLCLEQRMITPFSEGKLDGVVSYGLTSAGYDLRLDNKVWAYRNTRGHVVDPKKFKNLEYRDQLFDVYEVPMGSPIIVPGHNYVLVQSVETIKVPCYLKGRCVGKSTYARCGVIVNTTPLEPGWIGKLTIEISNSNPCPVLLWTGEGIAQLEFETLDVEPEVNYAQKGGKYQGQTDVTPPRLDSDG